MRTRGWPIIGSGRGVVGLNRVASQRRLASSARSLHGGGRRKAKGRRQPEAGPPLPGLRVKTIRPKSIREHSLAANLGLHRIGDEAGLVRLVVKLLDLGAARPLL